MRPLNAWIPSTRAEKTKKKCQPRRIFGIAPALFSLAFMRRVPPQLGGVGRQLTGDRRAARKAGLRAGEVAGQLGTNQTVEFRPRPRSNQKCEHGSSAVAPSPRVTFQVAGSGVPSMPRACVR